ncbi:MAG: sensor histidine kinase [Nannocystaceae bacterium]
MDRSPSLALRRTLAARLLPLAVLLTLVVAAAAPLAYFALALRALAVQARGTAVQIAREIGREVEERPILWRYDTLKLAQHLHSVADDAGLLAVGVVDLEGRPVDVGVGFDEAETRPVLWVDAPLVLHGETVAVVWVAADPDAAGRGALLLLAGFGALGLVLGALVYFLPMRAIGRAEDRIVALIDRLARAREALEAQSQTLEEQVIARSAELRAAYEAIRGKEEHLRQIASRSVALQEAERRVIARELHDSAGQALTAIRIHLQLIAQSRESPEAVARLADKTMTITDATLEEIRRAVAMLGPAILDDVGLEAALERLCDDLREDGRTEIELHVDLPSGGLTPALESTIYRLTQEALTNIARHASACSVQVEIVAEDAEVRLTIRDDGRGFEVAAALARGRSRGLVGMRERVELLGGVLELRSAPGEGAVVTAHLPRLSLAGDGDDSAIVVA